MSGAKRPAKGRYRGSKKDPFRRQVLGVYRPPKTPGCICQKPPARVSPDCPIHGEPEA